MKPKDWREMKRVALAQASILVSVETAAILLDLSVSTISKLRGMRRFPPAVTGLGKSTRFLRSDLVLWAENDCPDEDTFRRLK